MLDESEFHTTWLFKSNLLVNKYSPTTMERIIIYQLHFCVAKPTVERQIIRLWDSISWCGDKFPSYNFIFPGLITAWWLWIADHSSAMRSLMSNMISLHISNRKSVHVFLLISQRNVYIDGVCGNKIYDSVNSNGNIFNHRMMSNCDKIRHIYYILCIQCGHGLNEELFN